MYVGGESSDRLKVVTLFVTCYLLLLLLGYFFCFALLIMMHTHSHTYTLNETATARQASNQCTYTSKQRKNKNNTILFAFACYHVCYVFKTLVLVSCPTKWWLNTHIFKHPNCGSCLCANVGKIFVYSALL